MRFDVGGVDHLRVCQSTIAGELAEQVFPYATPRPPSEAIVDRRRRPVGFRTIGPAAAAFQHVYDAADDAAIILSLDTTHIGWQAGFDPPPLLVAQPKQIPAHDPNPSLKRISIVWSQQKN
jgi:hypothetical protein